MSRYFALLLINPWNVAVQLTQEVSPCCHVHVCALQAGSREAASHPAAQGSDPNSMLACGWQCVTLCGSVPMGTGCPPETVKSFMRTTSRKSRANAQQLRVMVGEKQRGSSSFTCGQRVELFVIHSWCYFEPWESWVSLLFLFYLFAYFWLPHRNPGEGRLLAAQP